MIAVGESSVGHPAMRRDRLRRADAGQYPASAADHPEQDCLDQELQQDVHAPGADRHPDADLAGALGDRDQQDVHDADAADQQRDRCHGSEQQRHDPAAALGRLRHLAQVAHVEVVILAGLDVMAVVQRLDYLIHRLRDERLALGLDEDIVHHARQFGRAAEGTGLGRVGTVDRTRGRYRRVRIRGARRRRARGTSRGRRRDAEDFALGGAERNQHHVVLVLAPA